MDSLFFLLWMFFDVLLISVLFFAGRVACDDTSAINHFVAFGDSYTADQADECNGPKWIRQLAWDNMTIDNHAVGGAYCVNTNNTRSTSVNQQTMQYINSMPDNDPATTVYSIFVGINDMVGQVEPTEVLHCISEQMGRLHQALNARNFLVFNMVPFDRSPRESGQAAAAQEWIQQFNNQINDTIQRGPQGVQAILIDTHSIVSQVLDNLGSFGITMGTADYYARIHDPLRNDTDALVEGNKYFWFDKNHLTSVVHTYIAKSVVEQNPFPSLPLLSAGHPSIHKPATHLLLAIVFALFALV